ncbi:MAG: hypothetical protein D6731_06185 [Planctomycetota bacterium]|nr:MAG: hypothetical protein D6731_06185 [Planctomycetota bacterium]
MKRAVLGALALACGLGAWLSFGQEDSSPASDRPAKEEPRALWQEAGRCEACHVEASWRELVEPPAELFDHATTGFPLRGAHAEAECSDCHLRGLSALSQSCDRCHQDPHGGLRGKTCTACHTEVDWVVPRNWFDHDRTRFPLQGKHAALACEACHRGMRGEAPAIAPTECIACHADDWRRAVPDHTAGGAAFAVPHCQRCHFNVTPPMTFDGATVVPP